MEILLSFTLQSKWGKSIWHWLQRKISTEKGTRDSSILKLLRFVLAFFFFSFLPKTDLMLSETSVSLRQFCILGNGVSPHDLCCPYLRDNAVTF